MSGRNNVLVVDDEFDVATSLGLMLENFGFKVDVFSDPEETLKSFKAGIYDLVILDVKMPKINGFELYSKIKSIEPNIRALFITALTELSDYEEFRGQVSPRLHQRHFVQKPVTTDQLMERVFSILR